MAASRRSPRTTRVRGRARQLGTLEAGKVADMVLLNGDPLASVASLLNVTTVIKAGEVVFTRR